MYSSQFPYATVSSSTVVSKGHPSDPFADDGPNVHRRPSPDPLATKTPIMPHSFETSPKDTSGVIQPLTSTEVELLPSLLRDVLRLNDEVLSNIGTIGSECEQWAEEQQRQNCLLEIAEKDTESGKAMGAMPKQEMAENPSSTITGLQVLLKGPLGLSVRVDPVENESGNEQDEEIFNIGLGIADGQLAARMSMESTAPLVSLIEEPTHKQEKTQGQWRRLWGRVAGNKFKEASNE